MARSILVRQSLRIVSSVLVLGIVLAEQNQRSAFSSRRSGAAGWSFRRSLNRPHIFKILREGVHCTV